MNLKDVINAWNQKKIIYVTAFFGFVVGAASLSVAQAHSEPSPDLSRVSGASANAFDFSEDEDEGLPRRFIQWPRVTIGLVWSDPSGSMRVMDLGAAPENGSFTPEVLVSRCMRAAGRLSVDGINNETFSGTSTRSLQPLSDKEVDELIHGVSRRK